MNPNENNTRPVSQALARLQIRHLPEAWMVRRAQSLARSEHDSSAGELIRLAVLDPLMAVWILKRANSSYYGLRSEVDSLIRAFDVLGESTVVGMFADTAGSSDIANEHPDVVPTPGPLTWHSGATAVIASILEADSAALGGPAFTAGLLHDIGKHVFSLNYPIEASKMYGSTALWESLQSDDLSSVEQLAFDLDHREVGEFVARKMQFPEFLTEVVRHHASPHLLSAGHGAYRMSHVVNLASFAATAMGYAAGEPVSWEKCTSDTRWDRMVSAGLTPFKTKRAAQDACLSAATTIEDLFNIDASLPDILMKSDQRTNRTTRAPISNSRTTARSPGLPGEPVDH